VLNSQFKPNFFAVLAIYLLHVKACLGVVMRQKHLNKFALWCIAYIALPVSANDFSPYSPAYIVDSGQVLSDSKVSSTWINDRSYDRSYDYATSYGGSYPSYSSKQTNVDLSQAFTIGLPYEFEIGASINYSDTVQANPYQAANFVGELDNPTFFLNKFWNTDSSLWGKASFSATPKTGDSGSKSAASKYIVGLTGIYLVDETLVTSLGVTYEMVDPIYPQSSNTTGVRAVISKEVGLNLVNLKLGARRIEPWLSSYTYTSSSSSTGNDSYTFGSQYQGNPSWIYQAGLELSRKIANQAWLGLTYDIAYRYSSFDFSSSSSWQSNLWGSDTWNYSESYKRSTLQNRVMLSLKAVF